MQNLPFPPPGLPYGMFYMNFWHVDVFPSSFKTETWKKFVYIKPFQFQRKGIKYIWLFYDLEESD